MQLIEINGNTLHCKQSTTKIYNIRDKKNALGLLYILKDIVNNTLSYIEPNYQCCINFIY